MRGSILFGMILFLGISTSYGSELNEFFFENPSTNLTFSKPFEDQGELQGFCTKFDCGFKYMKDL